MKKRIILLATVLSILITLFPAPVAYAASEEAVSAAETLHELGLFNGTGTDANGNPIYDLDRAPTRYEAVTMLVRLLGKGEEAQNRTWNTPFVDVVNWAKPYVGYAYANGLTSGTSATTFGGDSNVSATQYCTFVLRALGYDSSKDFKWNEAVNLTDQLGITNGQYTNSATFTRGDVAVISLKSLSVLKKDSTETILQTMGKSKIPDYAKINSNTFLFIGIA